MSALRFVDCQGLAGAWTLGTVQAGFELVSRATLARTEEKAGFGDIVIDANRHLVGDGWKQQLGCNLEDWEVVEDIAYLCGTPPCSGFSLLNNAAAAARKAGKENPATARGANSSINDCMKALVRYGGTKIYGRDGRRGADVIAFESVQGAFKQGRELMQYMLERLREDTGLDYNLTHVLMSGASVGNAQMRHRYYFVAHRIPFGVDQPAMRRVATYRDAIGDLTPLKATWDAQSYVAPASSYAAGLLDPSGKVTGHYSINDEKDAAGELPARFGAVFGKPGGLIEYWRAGESLDVCLKRYMDANGGSVPETLMEVGPGKSNIVRWFDFDKDIRRGFSGQHRIPADKPGYVLTGGCLADQIHYSEDRLLTVREGSRMMGYPDTWQWDTAKSVMGAGMWIGKCCPVQSGQWISTAVRAALEGDPGEPGEQIGPHEFLHNSTNAYKTWPVGC